MREEQAFLPKNIGENIMDAFERASNEMKITDPTMKYSICWRCGLEKPLTSHHAIPVALKPIYIRRLQTKRVMTHNKK